MSDNGYQIKVDDLILFFRHGEQGRKPGEQEVVVNRLIPHDFYTKPELRVPDAGVLPEWRDAVLSEPKVGNYAGRQAETRPARDGQPDESYCVVNLARLAPPNGPEEGAARRSAPHASGAFTPAAGDLVVFPPENPAECYRVPREMYVSQCRQLDNDDIPDLEYMVSDEGVVLANVPKPTPEGCTCILLNLVSLRSRMLRGPANRELSKHEHARELGAALRAGHKR